MPIKWMCTVFLLLGLTGLGACTTADYSDGVNGFSQAVTAAAAVGPPLAAAAQQAEETQLLQSLAITDPRTVTLDPGCLGVSPTGYHQGDCSVIIGTAKLGYAGALPNMVSLTKYAAALSAIVADSSCTTLQTDAIGLATAVGDIATKAGGSDTAASAGPISQIVAVAACTAIDAMQLRILRTATDAANPLIQKLVPLIANAYQLYYDTALNDAEKQTLIAVVAYQNAAALYGKSKSPVDLEKESTSLTRANILAAAVDKARTSPPPGPVVIKIATLHQTLTDDLKSQTVSLKRVLNESHAFVTEANAVTAAAEALQAANAQAVPPTVKPATKPTR
jgi:hypothetical protein